MGYALCINEFKSSEPILRIVIHTDSFQANPSISGAIFYIPASYVATRNQFSSKPPWSMLRISLIRSHFRHVKYDNPKLAWIFTIIKWFGDQRMGGFSLSSKIQDFSQIFTGGGKVLQCERVRVSSWHISYPFSIWDPRYPPISAYIPSDHFPSLSPLFSPRNMSKASTDQKTRAFVTEYLFLQ